MGSLHDSRIHKWFATSPPVAWTVRQLRELLIGSLKQGPIPQHVAFVMDGNRRFARNHHIETVEGHNLGFESLARVWVTGIQVSQCYANIATRSSKSATKLASRLSPSMHSA
ncbi:dehydrodolichyl diphosphate synthase [Alternaria alternata]|nr:dehydrodolichyl diphosphate synthase [Alternaria alternata]